MSERHIGSLHSWSSQVLSGVSVVCRCKIPFVPELSDLPKWKQLSSSLDYDFIQERQAVADYEQYWEQRHNLEFQASPQLGNSPTQRGCSDSPPNPMPQSSVPQQCSGSPTFNCVEQSPTHEPTLRLSSGQLHSGAMLSPLYIYSPPVAASHLVPDQVLQPKKTDCTTLPVSSKIDESMHTTLVPGSITHTISTSPTKAEQGSFTGLYLPDFDSGPDDPFTSVELNTINELEELRRVLVSAPITGPPPSTTLPCQEPLAHFSNAKQTFTPTVSKLTFHEPISSRISGQDDTTSVTASTLNPEVPALSSVATCASCSATTPGFHLIEDGFSTRPRKSFSSSVPNLEVTDSSSRPDPLTPPFFHPLPHPIYRPVARKLKTIPAFTGPPDASSLALASQHPVESIAPPSNPHFQALVSWASNCRFSIPRTMQLLQLDRTNSNLLRLPLEQAKQILADQLRLADLLMSEFSQPRHPNHLSERSALLAASAFTYDVAKARQFASITLALEQSGYPQAVSQSYLLNASQDPNAALNIMLCTLSSLRTTSPHPLPVVRRSTTPSQVVTTDHLTPSQIN